MIIKNNPLNYFLCNMPIHMPITPTHYITGKNLLVFKNLTSIENSLTTLSCNLKNFYNNLHYK